jgi:hypothetical protein
VIHRPGKKLWREEYNQHSLFGIGLAYTFSRKSSPDQVSSPCFIIANNANQPHPFTYPGHLLLDEHSEFRNAQCESTDFSQELASKASRCHLPDILTLGNLRNKNY